MPCRLLGLAGMLLVAAVAGARPMYAAAAAKAAGAQALPAKADLAAEFQKLGFAAVSQGGRDTCSLFAITALAGFEYARAGPPPHAPLSEEFLIWAADEATGRKGDQAMFYEAVTGLDALGICTRDLMPYEGAADAARKPSAAALADAAGRRARWRAHWIRRWDVSRPMTDAQVLAIKAAIAAGHPVACGLRWPIVLKSHKLLDVPPPDKVHDGHSIALVGYADDAKQEGGGTFVFRNSSGPAWGDGGYGVMSYAYARAYANDAVWLECGPPNSEAPVERFEAESLAPAAAARCEAKPQDMAPWGGPMWSGGKQLFCRAEEGGFVEFTLPVRKAGRYRLCVLATTAPDSGVVRASLDGKRLGDDFDLYSGRVSPTGPVVLGTVNLRAGPHRLRLAATGRNPSSGGFSFGLDAVDLRPVP